MSYFGDIDYEILRVENKQLKSVVKTYRADIEFYHHHIAQLKAQLEKAKCCGSCKWWEGNRLCVNKDSKNYSINTRIVMLVGEGCDKWEARE